MNVEFKNVSFAYEKELILDNFSASFKDNEMVTILGHNGSGKSTLAKIMMGLLSVDSGEVVLDGKVLNEENLDSLRPRMGIVFQNPDNQFVGVTVRDDIAFGLENAQIPREEMNDLVDKYINLVDMKDFAKCNPEELSGGQKQRVAIAGILAMNADLIIFDESTSMLDPKGCREVNQMIKRIKEEGNKTIITITHNLEEASYADRVIVLNKGKIVCDGKPQDVFKETEILEQSGLKTIDAVSIINDIKNKDIYNKKEIIDTLWESTFKM